MLGNDELGIPLGITVDFDTIRDKEENSITLRERDSTMQARGSVQEIVDAIKRLVENVEWWPGCLRETAQVC